MLRSAIIASYSRQQYRAAVSYYSFILSTAIPWCDQVLWLHILVSNTMLPSAIIASYFGQQYRAAVSYYSFIFWSAIPWCDQLLQLHILVSTTVVRSAIIASYFGQQYHGAVSYYSFILSTQTAVSASVRIVIMALKINKDTCGEIMCTIMCT